jgi:hypothetical protein
LRWRGARPELAALCAEFELGDVPTGLLPI